MEHKETGIRKCKADDLFISHGNILECGNCGAREDDKTTKTKSLKSNKL